MAYSSSSTGSGIDTTADKAAKFVRTMAAVVGAVFLLVGILGFIPGITSQYNTMELLGNKSDAHLLGIFEVSVLHNVVHLLFGVAGLAMAKATKSATTYLIGGGIIYLVLAAYGFLVADNNAANFVPVNTADDLLHLVLGVGMVALGLPGRRAVDSHGSRTVA